MMTVVAHWARLQHQVLVQTEGQLGLSGNINVLPFRQHLRTSTRRATSDGADSSAFTTAGDRADDRAGQRAAAYVFTGTLVLADAGLLRRGS